ncbi:hypothetical protein [Actinosynnema sp. NPDC023587]|uniref:hypothetical protein n=1 Tax=Actinosynnema sp. NPDC023587 TaxID=3154695 RepID=UPI0033C27C49
MQPDPRRLYTSLRTLDYRIPEFAMPVIAHVHTGGTVLDVCCSYGVGAAQLRYTLSIADLTVRYRDPALATLDPRALVAADRKFFAAREQRRDVRVVGLDASTPAIRYALNVGLMADGWAEDLERSEPSAALVAGLAGVRTITCTGGVGYVGAATFRRILDVHPDPANLRAVLFVLRVFDYAEIVRAFAERDLVAERLPGVTFPQRRFANAAERDSALRDLADRRVDAAGKEDSGWFHAECVIVRPAVEAARVPVGELAARISARPSPNLVRPAPSVDRDDVVAGNRSGGGACARPTIPSRG